MRLTQIEQPDCTVIPTRRRNGTNFSTYMERRRRSNSSSVGAISPCRRRSRARRTASVAKARTTGKISHACTKLSSCATGATGAPSSEKHASMQRCSTPSMASPTRLQRAHQQHGTRHSSRRNALMVGWVKNSVTTSGTMRLLRLADASVRGSSSDTTTSSPSSNSQLSMSPA